MAAGTSPVDFGLTEAELDALLSTDANELDCLFEFGDHGAPSVLPIALHENTYSPTDVLEGTNPSFARYGEAENKELASKSEAQKERIKAKNRRAQNKYREKQKQKMKETEQQVEEIGVELERLRMENARMQHSHDVMQRVLHLRDHALGMLQASKPSATDDLPSPKYNSVGAAATVTTPTASAELRTETSHPTTSSSSSLHSNGVAPPHQSDAAVSHSANEEASSGKEASGRPGEHVGTLAQAQICVYAQGGVCPHDPLSRKRLDELKQMSAEQLQAQWRGIVHRLSDALVASGAMSGGRMEGAGSRGEGGRDPAEQAALEETIRPILGEASFVCFEHAVGNPTNMQLLLTQALDDGKAQPPEDQRRKWAEVQAALQLRPEQQQQVTALRETFMRRMSRVMQERRQLFARLGALAALSEQQGLMAMRTATETWLKTHRSTQALEHNIHEEHVVSMEFIGGMMGGVLDSVQKAVAIVKSWPYFPDIYSITAACPQLEGQSTLLLEGCSREEVTA